MELGMGMGMRGEERGIEMDKRRLAFVRSRSPRACGPRKKTHHVTHARLR
jgi:hypothetical protein